MYETADRGQTLDLMARTLRMIEDRHGTWLAEAPQTRELVAEMIDSGITDEAELVELVELSGGKRYDPKTASFH